MERNPFVHSRVKNTDQFKDYNRPLKITCFRFQRNPKTLKLDSEAILRNASKLTTSIPTRNIHLFFFVWILFSLGWYTRITI